MTLRDYTARDFRRLCEIDRRCFEPEVAYSAADMRGFLRAPGAFVIVAENRASEVVAFALAELEGRLRGHIITLDVLPQYRGRGLGRKLLAACEERLQAAGAPSVRLETAVANLSAQALYRSAGYTRIKRAARYYATGEDAWVMEKRLVRAKAAPGSA